MYPGFETRRRDFFFALHQKSPQTKPKRRRFGKSSPRQTLNGYLSAIFGVWFGDKDMCAMVHTIND